MSRFREDALRYHRSDRPAKIEVSVTKPFTTQRDLSLAYTPGVAEPCREIHADPEQAYAYTAKGNLVAVVTNGSAVLGLGNIGALAGKPVMEGKAVLFKRFADIDVFDLELDTDDPEDFVRTVKHLEPSFGGINLEDIKAPECFYIEERLSREMNIPVFHDDQQGTAIISGAGLLNALALTGKDIGRVRIVYNGAGAAGIACARLHVALGARPENLTLCDSKGVIYRGRTEGMNPHKEAFAVDTDARTLTQALDGADVFIGISVPGVLTPEAVRSMADDPVVFALANPDPEIDYETAVRTREDIILATGRSDYPNQVNNVLGFPFIFRGALDVRAKAINQDMKIAAVHALAEFAREEVPDSVLRAYGVEEMAFDPNYIIPKPLDHRVLLRVAPAIARAAMETGAARVDIDLDEYREALERRLDRSREIMRTAINKARLGPRRIIFPEGDHAKILRACRIIVDEGIAKPILIGPEAQIRRRIQDHGLQPEEVVIEDPATSPHRGAYVRELFQLRHRKGITMREAEEMMADRNVYGAVMVHVGDADGLVSGVTQHYPDTIRPALQVIGTRDDVDRVCGLYIMIVKNSAYFFSDATVNIEPTPETLAEIALESARVAREFNFEPRVAMLSFSNFGSSRHALADRVQRAVEIVRQRDPDLQIDGEMQADTAVNPDIAAEGYPFSAVQGDANVLIFPDLQSGNIAYKLLRELGGAEAIGPILMGMRKPVHVLPRGCDVDAIVNMAAIAVLDAQELERRARNA